MLFEFFDSKKMLVTKKLGLVPFLVVCGALIHEIGLGECETFRHSSAESGVS